MSVLNEKVKKRDYRSQVSIKEVKKQINEIVFF